MVVLNGITAAGRQHARILLSGTKADAHFLIRNMLYITFEHHLTGHIVGIRIPLVKHHRIALPEIRENRCRQ